MVALRRLVAGILWTNKVRSIFVPSLLPRLLRFAQNPLHTFPRNFPIDGEIANLLRTC